MEHKSFGMTRYAFCMYAYKWHSYLLKNMKNYWSCFLAIHDTPQILNSSGLHKYIPDWYCHKDSGNAMQNLTEKWQRSE